MKRLPHTIALLLLLLTATSCDSYLINGPLDGMWQLQSIERHTPDTVIQTAGDLFYSFQRHSVLVGDYINSNELAGHLKEEQYISLFTLTDDSLTMHEFHLYYKREHLPYDTTRLKRFGIYDTPVTFHVEELTSRRLVLCSDSARLTLRKY